MERHDRGVPTMLQNDGEDETAVRYASDGCPELW